MEVENRASEDDWHHLKITGNIILGRWGLWGRRGLLESCKNEDGKC